MKAMKSVYVFAAMVSLSACGTESQSPSPTPSDPPVSVSDSTASAVTLLDCQKQVATCTRAAKSFADLGHCTTQFQSCTTQAAADLVGQTNLLTNCRSKATSCLDGAVTLSDVSACRDVFDACAGDVQATANDAVKTAIDAARAAVDKATNVAVGVIQGASDTASSALDAIAACEKKANACLDAALSLSNVSACQDTFETCAGQAVSLVDKVVAPLPGPTPTEIATGLTDCQTQATACLAKAVTSADISACNGALSICVKDSTTLVDQTINDVNDLLPPALQLTSPTKPVDCSAQATQCLLNLGNPLDCAAQAAACLGS